MSRTYKKNAIGRWGYYRHPKGNKQAKIQGCRSKAIPPDAWDDIPHNHDNYIIHKIARKLHMEKGWSLDRIARHLVKIYGLESWQARKIVGNGFYRCTCEECNRI